MDWCLVIHHAVRLALRLCRGGVDCTNRESWTILRDEPNGGRSYLVLGVEFSRPGMMIDIFNGGLDAPLVHDAIRQAVRLAVVVASAGSPECGSTTSFADGEYVKTSLSVVTKPPRRRRKET